MSTGLRSTRARRALFVLAFTLSLASGLAGCGCSGSKGSFSGRYQASQGTESITLDFRNEERVTVSLTSGDGEEELSHDCRYTVDGRTITITTQEPLGAPLCLTIEGGTLRDGTGFVYKKM